MAKGLSVLFEGKASALNLSSIDRSDIYGKRRRLAIDADGQTCVRVSMLADGSLILKSGMTSQGYFLDDGTYLKQAELEAFTPDGIAIVKTPSSLGVSQELIGPVSPTEVLDLRITAVYELAPEELDPALKTSLDSGDIYKITFTYRDSYEPSDAYIFSNKEGLFMMAGTANQYEWSTLETLASLPSQDDVDDDDLDFDML